ncbi:mannan endo-1,4-beta-mannosidase-like [Ruditapes philippinarum]|uniref:mannan endo-1,4-beta-mannosidase-like n=1 Tax=Ruditapes philippinarum TaxID=129788 RepID=UPI00295C137E|nr:mannan endo-1,4-beta-mannosidase-like [Ruditapes philippinarum]
MVDTRHVFPVAIALISLMFNCCDAGRLHVQGTNLVKDGQRVFLSGTNLAWVHYGYDFGNNQYSGVKTQFEQYLSQIHASGGNSIRVWLHIEGESSPHFTSQGYVDKTDAAGSLINDMRSFLTSAKHFNVFVFFVLWNGAKKQNTHYRLDGLIRDSNKLQSYIDHCLKPMVNALKNEPALGGWEIINEPEGELTPDHHSNNPCQDTTHLHNSGAGWEGHLYSAAQIQKFVNWQADAIRSTDPGALVTLGVWNPKSNTDKFGFRNLYSDHCLTSAGGKAHGTLSFYQMHTYTFSGHFDGYSPFQHHASEFGLNKPLVIGEFRQESGTNPITDMYNYAYYYGYSGAWGWAASDSNQWSLIKKGMAWLRGRNDQQKGGLINVHV